MPRTARTKSVTGLYHIIMRGINRQRIFEDEDDHYRFIHTLRKYKEISGYLLFAYCLMDNHIHLLLKVELEPLEQIMRRLCGSYVYWYNRKYERTGNLFEDRFKSECVEDDGYFLTVLRYIHQNPLNAGLVNDVSSYRWSSYREYLKPTGLVNAEFALSLFHLNRDQAVQLFVEHQKTITDESCLEIEEKKRFTDQKCAEIIKKSCQVKNAIDLQKMEKSKRDACLRMLKESGNLSIRQISRLTGISRGVVTKA